MKWLTRKRNFNKIKEKSKQKRFDLFTIKLDTNFNECGIIPQSFEWEFEKPSKSKNEDVFIHGVNSNGDVFALRCLRLHQENGTCLQNAHLVFKIGTDTYDFEAVDLVHNEETLVYKINGLEIHVISPFRLIRIVFRGLLRKTAENGETERLFTRIRLFWSPVSKVVDFKVVNDASFIAGQLDNVEFNDDMFEDRYEQYGELKGTIQFETNPFRKVFFWGNKCKTFFENNLNLDRNWKRMYAYSKKGLAFHVGFSMDKNAKKSFICGNCFYNFPNAEAITKTSLTMEDCDHLVKITELQLTYVGPRKFDVKISDGSQLSNSYFHKKLTINEANGMCLIVDHNSVNLDELKQRVAEKILSPLITTDCDDFVIDLRSNQFSNTCGGKGSSLSIMSYLSQHIKSNDLPKFTVPNGIVITTTAYQHFLASNTSIYDTIENLQNSLWKHQVDGMKTECNKVVDEVSKASLPLDLKEEINRRLKLAFGEGFDNLKFAVRSSAVGEDSEELSAAGQMSSYLGVIGFENICSAVVKCWASQFTHIAVEYKLGYGQLINSPMAVVIQEMVDCDVAGVLFTCNPVDGDPRRVLITANYGLCESVVSSAAEPDTVTVLVDPVNEKIEKIENIVVGSKNISIKMGDTGGTEETSVNAGDKSRCCIDESMGIELTKVSLFLKKCFGNERDIEWGIKDGVIYLLQSRPVTNLNGFSEWEIMHEMDRATSREEPLASKANVGEVMPGSETFLGMTFMLGCFAPPGAIRFNRAGIDGNYFYSPYVNPGWIIVCNQFMFDLSGFAQIAPGKPNSPFRRAMRYSMFGPNIGDDIFGEKDTRLDGKVPLKLKIQAGIFFTREILHSSSRLKKEVRKYDNFALLDDKTSFKSSKELFNYIIDNSHRSYKGLIRHQECTGNSMSGYLGVFSVFTKNEEENPHLFTDISLLFSNNKDVESVQLPLLFQEVAECIEDREAFAKMSDEDALNYLMKGDTDAGRKFKALLQQHGHRGYKEFDVGYHQLGDNPMPTIKLLKSIVGSEHKFTAKRLLTRQEIVSSLKSDLNWRQKLMLKKFVLPWCQKGVGLREQSKSFLVRILNEYRKAMWKLAEMMSEEGRIPDKELLFYLKLEEVDKLLTTRDATLVSRAKHRRKLFQKMDKLQFDEITKGPDFVARNEDEYSFPSADLLNCEKVIGMTVCIGKVEARAAVAKNIDEAVNIEPGDILIAYSTDIGWSPYFPKISGIVTEIGGLISHGAVIARECGLPCIVGAKYATDIFKTGDRVILDAENGFICKVPTEQ